MQIKLSAPPPDAIKADLIVLLVHSAESWNDLRDDSPTQTVNDYREAAARKAVRDPLIWGGPALGGYKRQAGYWMLAPERIDRFPLGEQIKIAAARAIDYARSLRLKKVAFLLNTRSGADRAPEVVEGALLGGYRFEKYITREKPNPPEIELEILVAKDALKTSQQALARTRIVCDALNYARDLANEPGSVLYPKILAGEAQSICRKTRLRCEILDEKQLKRKGYNGLLAVGRGSPHAPRLIVIGYKPRRPSPVHLALVGKGITFDTGGINLKRTDDIWRMKGDMSGAAAVLATLRAIAQLAPDIRVTGILPAAHNAVGPNAVHPGDIIRARNGKTIEIQNTDAEGRIILTDGLHRAGEEGATHIVDVATLTGSCQRALGHAVAGLFSEDADLNARILGAGAQVGENFWPLPLLDEYRELIKSAVADINNMPSSRNGGAITAALFLREFVPPGIPWAHLDIAGTAFLEKDWKYFRKGATGSTTRTLIQLATQDWDAAQS